MRLFLFLLVAMFLALIAQEFIPPLEGLYGARVYLMPVILFYGALALPFPWMLALAFCAGFMWDCLTVQVMDSQVEISLGWSILLYALLGSIMHGLRPLFLRGRWEVHCLLSGVCTSSILLAEFLMLTFRRGGFIFTREIWWRILGPGVMAMLIAPVVFFIFNWMAGVIAYRMVPEEPEFE